MADVVLETTLKDLEKNIKFWIKQGFTKFTVKVTDYNSTININVKKSN